MEIVHPLGTMLYLANYTRVFRSENSFEMSSVTAFRISNQIKKRARLNFFDQLEEELVRHPRGPATIICIPGVSSGADGNWETQDVPTRIYGQESLVQSMSQ